MSILLIGIFRQPKYQIDLDFNQICQNSMQFKLHAKEICMIIVLPPKKPVNQERASS